MVAGPLIYPVENPLDDDVVLMHRNQITGQAYTFGAGAQELADYIGNLQKAHAGISVVANGGAQVLVPGAWAQIAAFNVNDAPIVNATPNAAANGVTMGVDGDVSARASISLLGPPTAIYLIDVYKNGAPTGHRTQVAIDAAGAANSCSVESINNSLLGDFFDLWIMSAATATVTITDAQFVVQKL